MTRPFPARPCNVRIAGLGGMGVLTAARFLAETAFRAGWDVKRADVHGMSQRGGSVCSDVRFGHRIYSPTIPPGEIDYLVALTMPAADLHRAQLAPAGVILAPGDLAPGTVDHPRTLNLAMMGLLSARMGVPEPKHWIEALRDQFAQPLREPNERAFLAGRTSAARVKGGTTTTGGEEEDRNAAL
jgi:indolepyruvate ferredoxin oxidoreductase beta subunit